MRFWFFLLFFLSLFTSHFLNFSLSIILISEFYFILKHIYFFYIRHFVTFFIFIYYCFSIKTIVLSSHFALNCDIFPDFYFQNHYFFKRCRCIRTWTSNGSVHGGEGRSLKLIDIRPIRGLALVWRSVVVLVGDDGGGKFKERWFSIGIYYHFPVLKADFSGMIGLGFVARDERDDSSELLVLL